MTYALIDRVISGWAERHSIQIGESFGERPARYGYTSTSRGECFQVSIEEPEGGRVTVHAWTVETNDDAEMHEAWSVPIPELHAALEGALKKIGEWSVR